MVRPIGILYEHPEWFSPLFAELDRRDLPYERIAAHEHRFDPSARSSPYSLVVNRVSPSSYLRGHTSAIFHAQQYLAHLEAIGVPLVNGSRAHAFETSKARQLTLLAALDLPHPRSQVVNHVSQIEAAAGELSFPIIVKPNVGGSGALMRRLATPAELSHALVNGELAGALGLDHTAIVQEYHPPRDGSIVRVEALDGRFLYAIRIYSDPTEGFNLCPADICQVPNLPRRRNRRRRRRVPRERARRRALLLRRERALQLRHGRADAAGLRPIRALRGLPRTPRRPRRSLPSRRRLVTSPSRRRGRRAYRRNVSASSAPPR